MKKVFRCWLVTEETESAVPPEETPDRTLMAEFDVEEEAMVFKTEILRRYAPKATGEADVTGTIDDRDNYTPG